MNRKQHASTLQPIPLTPTKNNAGFTLLEVMIAIAILVVALGSIIAIQGSSINATMRARTMNTVAMLAKSQMVETEFKIQGKAFEEVRKEEQGQFPAPHQDYRWITTVKEIKFPQIRLPGAGNGAGGGSDGAASGGAPGFSGGQGNMEEMVAKLTTNFLSKAIREVTVEVLWRQGKTEQSFSLTTYWVDLNYEFSLTE